MSDDELRVALIRDLLAAMDYLDEEADVTSVFGRVGDIEAQEGDYSYDLIEGTHDNSAHTYDYATQMYAESISNDLDDHKSDGEIHVPIKISNDETENPPEGGIIFYYDDS